MEARDSRPRTEDGLEGMASMFFSLCGSWKKKNRLPAPGGLWE